MSLLDRLRCALQRAMLAATVLLALMAAIFVLGLLLLLPRSYILSDGLSWDQSRFLNTVVSSQGRLKWQLLDLNQHPDWPRSRPQRGIFFYNPTEPRSLDIQGRSSSPAPSWIGFRFDWPAPHSLEWTVVAPDWAIGLAFLAVFAVCYVRCRRLVQRAYRRFRGRCAICGYDLRATPHRCPECGTIVPPAAPAPGLIRRPP